MTSQEELRAIKDDETFEIVRETVQELEALTERLKRYLGDDISDREQ